MSTNPEGLVIRQACRADHSVWLGMVREYDADVTGQAEDAWRRILDDESDVVGLIATVDGEIAAFAHYVLHDFPFRAGPVCYLADLYVRPWYRRRGIARALLHHLIELADRNRWARLYWVTEHDNPARGLYDEVGIPQFVRYHRDFYV